MESLRTNAFRCGLDVLLDDHPDWLAGRRAALLSHPAALDRFGATSAERLHAELGEGLVALFGPEHGFWGLAGAGEETASGVHPAWGIPIHSLYGATRKPTPEMLRGIDVLVCDLQDLGARCYTYLATLDLALQACAGAGVEVVVADRPIPLPGVEDGPIAEERFFSFVAPLPLPMCTGMTPGQAARWICRHRDLSLPLRVAPMDGWDGQGRRAADWPDFIPPSPGIRSWEAGATYLATVSTEAIPVLDVGRGTSLAFRLVGAPWIDAGALRERLEDAALPGVRFHPHAYVAGTKPYGGTTIHGLRIGVVDPAAFRPVRTGVAILAALRDLYGGDRLWRSEGARPGWFDRLFGTDATRLALQDGAPADAIASAWATGSPGPAAVSG
ncbi:MAG: exo-beta-N-acetylmuramidase NamZ domain-containing protein [Kiritimatiellia bacterium]